VLVVHRGCARMPLWHLCAVLCPGSAVPAGVGAVGPCMHLPLSVGVWAGVGLWEGQKSKPYPLRLGLEAGPGWTTTDDVRPSWPLHWATPLAHHHLLMLPAFSGPPQGLLDVLKFRFCNPGRNPSLEGHAAVGGNGVVLPRGGAERAWITRPHRLSPRFP
jgi:hypothetical protein